MVVDIVTGCTTAIVAAAITEYPGGAAAHVLRMGTAGSDVGLLKAGPTAA